MRTVTLKLPVFGSIVATRAALAFGAGMLVAARVPDARRRKIGLALVGLGAATTVPAVMVIRRNMRRA